MRGLNKVTLIGNLGKDPEHQVLEGGVSLTKFSLATTEAYKDESGTTQTNTEWHTIIMWRNTADAAAKYLRKGSSIYVEGKLKTRNYDDKTGVKRYVTEIIADSFIMLDKPDSASDKADINASF